MAAGQSRTEGYRPMDPQLATFIGAKTAVTGSGRWATGWSREAGAVWLTPMYPTRTTWPAHSIAPLPTRNGWFGEVDAGDTGSRWAGQRDSPAAQWPLASAPSALTQTSRTYPMCCPNPSLLVNPQPWDPGRASRPAARQPYIQRQQVRTWGWRGGAGGPSAGRCVI
jgi:hypothetical protein